MNRKELIVELQKLGIDRVYGKTLSRAKKAEMEAIYDTLEGRAHLPYLRTTEVPTYLTCGLRYYWRRVRGLKIPPKWVMTLGSSVDAAANIGYEFKIATGRDTPTDVVTDSFVDDIRARTEETNWEEAKPDEVENQGLEIVKFWAEEVQPKRQPERTQVRHIVEFDRQLAHSLMTHRDLDNAPHQVLDMKVSGQKRPGPEVLEDDMQLIAYSIAYFDQFGVWPEVGLDILLRYKAGPQLQELRTKIKPEMIQRYLKTFAVVSDAISKGIFLPAAHTAMAYHRRVCTKESCGFFDKCHDEFL